MELRLKINHLQLRRYFMSNSKGSNNDLKSYIHIGIGVAIMLLFQVLPAYGPITEVGGSI